MTSKIVSLEAAAASVGSGAVVGVGGVMDQMVPVAILGELVRQRTRHLHAVSIASGFSMDLLLAGDCLDAISCAIVSFEDLGTSKLFRRRVEAGRVRFHEHTELTMITRLNAAASGVPYAVTRGALGTDVVRVNPEALRQTECPFTGAPVVACRALAPDVALIHAQAADPLGNVRSVRKHVWHDVLIARSARRVIVTVEELVDSAEVRAAPDDTILPSFAVDMVVHAPGGAAPTTCPGRYDTNREFISRWLAETTTDQGAESIVAEFLNTRAQRG